MPEHSPSGAMRLPVVNQGHPQDNENSPESAIEDFVAEDADVGTLIASSSQFSGTGIHDASASDPPASNSLHARDEEDTAHSQIAPEPAEVLDTLQSQLLQDVSTAAWQFAIQQRKFKASREQALVLRQRVDYERKEYHQKRDFVLESLQNIVESFASIPDDTAFMEKMSHLKGLRGSLQQDQKALDDKADELRNLEDLLNSVEYLMKEREETLTNAAEGALEALEKLGISVEEVHTAPHSVAVAISERAVSPTFHPTLQYYYDKVGELKVTHARQVEFESKYNEAKVLRELERDQGVPLTVTDEEFEATFQPDRGQFAIWIKQAVETAERAREDCIEQGLDPEGWKEGRDDLEDDFPVSSSKAGRSNSPILPGSPEQVKFKFARHDVFPGEPHPQQADLRGSYQDEGEFGMNYIVGPSPEGPFVTDIASDEQIARRPEHFRERVERWMTDTGRDDVSTTSTSQSHRRRPLSVDSSPRMSPGSTVRDIIRQPTLPSRYDTRVSGASRLQPSATSFNAISDGAYFHKRHSSEPELFLRDFQPQRGPNDDPLDPP